MEDTAESPLSVQELTPKPLRITKRDFSEQNSVSPSPQVKDGSPMPTVRYESRIPRKPSFKPDLYEAYTVNSSVVKEDIATLQVESPTQIPDAALNVRKTRRRDTESSGSKAQTLPTEHIQAPSSETKHTCMQISSQDSNLPSQRVDESESSQQIISSLHEIPTSSDESAPGPLMNYGIDIGTPPAPLPFTYGHQRGASGGGSPKTNNKANVELRGPSNHSQLVINSQPSYKHRMMNRIASGFLTPLEPGIDLAIGEATLLSNRIATIGGRTEVKLRSATLDSAQSAQTQKSLASDLQSTIASFPSPPKATSTRQTSIDLHTQQLFQPTKLLKAKETTILGAKLAIVPETKSIITTDGDGEESFWVAVEVEGHIDQHITGQTDEHDGNYLDIVVLVDNSFYTSASALMSSCNIAGELASALDTDQDRIAICVTSPLHESMVGGGLIILPLTKIAPRKVKRMLDDIVGCATIPAKDYLAVEIGYAKGHLKLNAPQFPPDPRVCASVGHIIVLTPNPGAIPESAYSDRYIGLHVICPGSIPWRRTAMATGDGWRIYNHFQPLEPPNPARTTQLTQHHSKIRALIAHLRSGSATGKLLNLQVALKASPGCAIDGVVGKDSFPFLQPGEVRTIMVRIKMKTPHHDLAFPSDFGQTPGTSVNGRLVKDIGALLGPKSVPVLRAKLRYSHSKLPAGTVCEVKSAAIVEVANPPTPQAGYASGKDCKRRNSLISTSHVQKCLIYYLATHALDAEQGLKTLRDHFSSERGGAVCSDYLTLVINELKYQERIVQRLELAENVGDTFKELIEDRSRTNVGYKPYNWINLPDDEIQPSHPDLHHMGSTAAVLDPFSDEEIGSPYRPLHHMGSKATVVDTLSGNELASPSRGLRHAKSKAAMVNTSSEDDSTPPIGLRHIRSKATVIDASSEDELVWPPRRLRHTVSRATISRGFDEATGLQRVVRHARSRAAVGEGVDESREEVRKIWTGIKNQKQPKTGADQALYGEGPHMSHGSEETITQIQERALKNKRSAGQDTLVSIAQRARGNENVSPWL